MLQSPREVNPNLIISGVILTVRGGVQWHCKLRTLLYDAIH